MSLSNVGARIKALRKERGYTLKDMSEKTGISISFLSDIENSRSNPSLERLKEIADTLNTTTSYLMGENIKTNANESKLELTSKDEKEIEKRVEKIKKDFLNNQEGLMLSGNPVSEEAVQSIIDALEFGIRQAKIINKKYTPKKYRKNNEEND